MYIWQIIPKVSEKLVKQYPDFHPVILQLLANRGLIEKEEIKKFFQVNYNNLLDPFLFKHMNEAVDLIISHIKAGNKIVIYGDYDADGITASAILVEILTIFKANVGVYIPDRTSEGYGLNEKAIDEIARTETKLIITVDNGIRNKKEVAYIKNLGLNVIITDHHEAPVDKNDWPDCLIINPHAEDYSFKSLAGVGVSFKLTLALIKKSKLTEEQKKRLEERILDLVTIGTVADCVSLIGENRILVSYGLKMINKLPRIGLSELIKVAQGNGPKKDISSWNISWQIAPRINSAGRLDHANTAFRLLITKDQKEAKLISEKLNIKNSERQKLTEAIVESCKIKVEKEMLDDKILILVSPSLDENAKALDWPEGVIGLVAGKICELYSRPTLVITKMDKEIKGSGRSIEEFNITKAIEQANQYLVKFGGHAQACGFTVNNQVDLLKFAIDLKKIAKEQLIEIDLTSKLIIEAELNLLEINNQLVEKLEEFEPFGEGNLRPKFVSFNLIIIDKITMGADNQHVKFKFDNFWAVAFRQTEKWRELKIGDKVDVVYYIEFNEFNGRKTIQMNVIDIRGTAVSG
ncbi:single-stranded-DNA-specific exonuclease RecJ [Patescibacteria group bacterium]|nr:single-stranded-DNA-specific exonuclease RecJ [Patescibacteria group bacterium]MBU0879539.1 single-stranded-DNA-specific exonuclease RecJ [Patescibacteria group bacterium]MBU0880416.1 single-stranded-DNA-specific exonuclease RecJ [Patescibacteria group bacterium]MBU0897726.1 single-stranded-DNA-specific exonuclease RecJ [Patescibacteria group bacterium]MBU1783625.1 single-stranded-DNA-specific exonuclease RecJ [Patescibacteria group bacterium]